MLIYPGHPDFGTWMAIPPPDPRAGVNYVHRVNGAVMEAVTDDELEDYLQGGEYEERLDEIEEQEAEIPINEGLQSDVLYLPVSVAL